MIPPGTTVCGLFYSETKKDFYGIPLYIKMNHKIPPGTTVCGFFYSEIRKLKKTKK